MAGKTDVVVRFLGDTANLDKAMGHAESRLGKMGGVFNTIGSKIGGEFGEVLQNVGDAMDQLGEKGGKNLGAKLAVGGGAITGLGVALSTLGSANKQATDQLNAAIAATGKPLSQYQDAIKKTIETQANFAHSDDDTQQALAKLTEATNDPAKAIANMGLVANLAAAQHMTLSAAADQIARVLSGKAGRALSVYGITMGKSKDKTKDIQVAIDQLNQKLNGQAAASVDNFRGKVDILRTKLGDWAAQMGTTVGPALTAVGPVLMVTGALVQAGTLGWIKNTVATVASTVATRAATIGAKVMAAAQWLLNAAMDANPISLVVIAIAALAAGLVYAYKHSQTFRNIVQGAFRAVGDQIKAFGVIWGAVWDAVKTVVSAVWDFLRPIFDAIGKGISGIVNGIGKVAGFIGKIGGGALSGLKAVIPHFAGGTSYAPGGMALVGERGPELVNLPRGSQVYPHGTGPGGGIDYDRLAGAIVKAFNGVAASSQIRARSVTG